MVKLEDTWWRRIRLTVGGLAVTCGLSVAWQWWPGYVERVVAPLEIQAIGGHAYYVDLRLVAPRLFEIRADTNAMPLVSRLSLLEDGRTLGTAHAQHALIGTKGGGAYSHWGTGLYFSASDNSDPRTNGRRYVVQAPLVARHELVAVFALGVLLVVIGIYRSASPRVAALAVRIRHLTGVSPGHGLRADDVAASVRVVAVVLATVILAYLDTPC